MIATAFERELWLIALAWGGGVRVSLAVLDRILEAELRRTNIRAKA